MRLINTSTGLFEEFIGRNIPKYAILSHTWEEEEVSFKAMTNDPSFRSMKGYQKIMMTCRMASQAGYRYAWIDTCCIDKSSSAELSEAINSMYRWYQRSEICYVFLSDLLASASLGDLQCCRWFTRGWTLQELIAPRNILFLDQEWSIRGCKEDLIGELSKITGINTAILQYSQPLSSVAVAQKMSWAAHRETTRIEDTAYCLLGIFDVNMPLLYGEEGKAFRRLQEEIIKSTADFSIFAWRLPYATRKTRNSLDREFCGILSESPLHFAESKLLSKLPGQDWRDFSVSNRGIKIQTQVLCESVPDKQAYRYVLPLDCSWDTKVSVGIRLRKCGPDQFVREDPWNFMEYSEPLWPRTPRVRYLLTELPDVDVGPGPRLSGMNRFIAQTRSHALQIQLPLEMETYDAWPWGRYDEEDQVFFLSGDSAWDAAVMRFRTEFIGRHGKKVEFESMFYALGWSSSDIRQLQCTIVDCQSLSNALNEVQSQISGWDHTRYQVLEVLIHHKIPKASAAQIEIPGTKATLMVSFTPVLVTDPSICQDRFWRIEFSCKVYQGNDLPKIRSGKWK